MVSLLKGLIYYSQNQLDVYHQHFYHKYYISTYYLKVTAGKVLFENQVMFIGNNASSVSGAVYLLSYSQLRLASNTNLTFVNNTGRSKHIPM